jgi:hypothetical protein
MNEVRLVSPARSEVSPVMAVLATFRLRRVVIPEKLLKLPETFVLFTAQKVKPKELNADTLPSIFVQPDNSKEVRALLLLKAEREPPMLLE